MLGSLASQAWKPSWKTLSSRCEQDWRQHSARRSHGEITKLLLTAFRSKHCHSYSLEGRILCHRNWHVRRILWPNYMVVNDIYIGRGILRLREQEAPSVLDSRRSGGISNVKPSIAEECRSDLTESERLMGQSTPTHETRRLHTSKVSKHQCPED